MQLYSVPVESTPPVMSVGMKCMDEGYDFVRRAGKDLYLQKLDGTNSSDSSTLGAICPVKSQRGTRSRVLTSETAC